MSVGQDIQVINERVARESAFVDRLLAEVGKVIVGQQDMIERLLIGLLCNGHVLLEGVPGLAKTLAVNSLAQTIQASFKRIQFTPDLLPADLIGTMFSRSDRVERVQSGHYPIRIRSDAKYWRIFTAREFQKIIRYMLLHMHHAPGVTIHAHAGK